MSILTTVTFHYDVVRVVTVYGTPWFVAKDITQALGYDDIDHAIETHCKQTKTLTELIPGYSEELAIHFQTKLIPETDVNCLVLYSTLKQVEEFQHWITNKVIPSICQNNKPIKSGIDYTNQKQVMELIAEQHRQLVRALNKLEKLQPKPNFHNVLAKKSMKTQSIKFVTGFEYNLCHNYLDEYGVDSIPIDEFHITRNMMIIVLDKQVIRFFMNPSITSNQVVDFVMSRLERDIIFKITYEDIHEIA